MTQANDMPTATPETSSGPDWNTIPFDVPCGRCGASLRGQTEPRCPRCNLEFTWNDVLPVEELRCPYCSYQLIGLREQRCPECGRPFTLASVLDAARSRRNTFFENRWRKRPIRSLARTWYFAAFRPRKLWAGYDLSDPPRLLPLGMFAIVQWAVFKHGWDVAALAVDPIMNSLPRLLGTNQRFFYPFRPDRFFMPFMAVWCLLTFLSFQCFVVSKRIWRIRWTQLLRVYVHATAFASGCMALWCVLEAILDSTLFYSGFLRRVPQAYDWLGRGVLGLGLAVTWAHVWIGYHRYLKVPGGWGTAAMCMTLGYLLASLLRIYW